MAQTALARDPPIAFDSREGIWIGADEVFVQQTRDRWSVFSATGTVNKFAVDEGVVWVATDDGVIRFESNTLHSTTFGMDEARVWEFLRRENEEKSRAARKKVDFVRRRSRATLSNKIGFLTPPRGFLAICSSKNSQTRD